MATYCGSGSSSGSTTPNVTVNNCNSNGCGCNCGTGGTGGTGIPGGSGYGAGNDPIGDPNKPGSSTGGNDGSAPKGATGDMLRKLPKSDCSVMGTLAYGQALIDYRSAPFDLKDALLNTATSSGLIKASERASVKSVQFSLQALGYLATNVGALGIEVPLGGRPEDLVITYEGNAHIVNHNDSSFPSGGVLGNQCAYYDQKINCLTQSPIQLGGQLQGGNKLVTPNHDPANENDPAWIKVCLESVVMGSAGDMLFDEQWTRIADSLPDDTNSGFFALGGTTLPKNPGNGNPSPCVDPIANHSYSIFWKDVPTLAVGTKIKVDFDVTGGNVSVCTVVLSNAANADCGTATAPLPTLADGTWSSVSVPTITATTAFDRVLITWGGTSRRVDKLKVAKQ
jgi:hypothetical protein